MTAFRFINKQGLARHGRYLISPKAAWSISTTRQPRRRARTTSPPSACCIAADPVELDIHVQIASDKDVVDDATIHWAADRPLVHFGTVELTAKAPRDEEAHCPIIFDPIPRVDGIEPSDDPLLELRAADCLAQRERIAGGFAKRSDIALFTLRHKHGASSVQDVSLTAPVYNRFPNPLFAQG